MELELNVSFNVQGDISSSALHSVQEWNSRSECKSGLVENTHCYWKYLELEWKGFQELELNKVSIELHVAELIKGT